MFSRTDDPLADFKRYDRLMQQMLDECPRCAYCGARIQEEYPHEIDGELVCEECYAIPD